MEIAASMADVLRAREARTHGNRSLLQQAHTPSLVVLTVVSPGPVKDSPQIRRTFERGIAAVEQQFAHTWPLPTPTITVDHAGPHSAWPCPAPPVEAKALSVEVEGTPGGRLWDVDVLDDTLAPVPRSAVNLPPRPCLLCQAPAKECARSRRHPLTAVAAAVDRLARAHLEGVRHAVV